MKIPHSAFGSDIARRISIIRKMTETTSEAGNIAQSVSSKIDAYSKKLHGKLEDWNADNQKIKDLLSSGSVGEISAAFQGLRSAATEKPPSGKSYNTISGSQALALVNLVIGLNLSDSDLRDMSLDGFTFSYWIPPPPPGGDTSHDSFSPSDGPYNMYFLATMMIQPLLEDGCKITSISIQMTPKQAKNSMGILQDALNKAVVKDPAMLGQLQQLQQAIAQEQSDMKDDLLQTMYFFNAIKSNQRGLSSVLKTLNTIAEAGFRSLRQ